MYIYIYIMSTLSLSLYIYICLVSEKSTIPFFLPVATSRVVLLFLFRRLGQIWTVFCLISFFTSFCSMVRPVDASVKKEKKSFYGSSIRFIYGFYTVSFVRFSPQVPFTVFLQIVYRLLLPPVGSGRPFFTVCALVG